MEFGVCIPHYGVPIDAEGLRRFAARVEELGYDSIWVTDHIIVPQGLDIVYKERMLEPFAVLAHVAALTRRVKLGTSVIILGYRNPIVVAKMLATVDVLSGGRLIFGAAAGWMEGEFAALGVPFEQRGKLANEYLQVIRHLWTQPTAPFQGEYVHFSDVVFSPEPVQKPSPPIWVGGRSRRAVRRAVDYGDGWHPTQMGPDELAKEAAYMREYSTSKGRPKPPLLSLRGRPRFTDGAAGAERRPLSGTPQQIAQDLAVYQKAGLEYLVMDTGARSLEEALRTIERFAREVRPPVG
ncbi:MAG: TIGR03619 family F420-dependent LLM class oxidoreductase [Chloroflexi bacterium]|nr:TIGR03619 family F420-dependent LLM class oxidoreductase [Chloroflexota bacterium]